MADVFISYRNTPDRRIIVRRLATILRAHEITVWWDYGLEAGESYRAQITGELAKAGIVAPLWCAESIRSPWVRMEAELGKDKLVPARLQKVVPPEAFEAIQAADLIGWDGAVGNPRLLEFVRLICRRLGRPAIAPTDMIEDLGQLPAVVPLPEVAAAPAPSAPQSVGPAHDYAFWERQWEKQGTGANLVALRAIADEAPRYFADQARARIAEVEAEADRRRVEQAERAEQARKQAEQERVARERAAQAAQEEQYRKQGRLQVSVGNGRNDQIAWPKPGAGEPFRDVDIGPEMVVVPAGRFMMGEGSSQKQVAIEKPFAIGRFTLTFDEWDAAQAHADWQRHSGIAPRKANDYGWGRGRQPAIEVSWEDAKAYAKWLSAVTAKTYRLPSEAEWEYCCRAGTTTRYSTGDTITKQQAQFSEGERGSAKQAVKVGSFPPNTWGIYDMHGNVWELCEDAYDASFRVLRGGSWNNNPVNLRSSNRIRSQPDYRINDVGFRLVRTL